MVSVRDHERNVCRTRVADERRARGEPKLVGGGSTTLLTWDAKRNQPHMHNWQTGLRRNGSNIGLLQAEF